MHKQQPADIDLPLATGWTRRRGGRPCDHYAVGAQLGQGGCGTVFGAKRISDGLPVALKLVEKTEWDQFGTPWEVRLMSLVNHNNGHPNVLRLYEWFDAPEYYVLVLERPQPCRDLFAFCSPEKKLDEQQARVVIQQLLDALLHCQHSGVFHRDVKPENVLINTDTNHITLIDFGVGTRWMDTPYTSFAGTLQFTPPEWFSSGVYQAGPATVWSLGITLYNLVCGYFPYNTLGDPDTMGTTFYPEELSPSLVDFMQRCLAPEAEQRASLEELQHHPWLCPSCIQSDPEVAVTQELFRQMRSILNKLMAEKFERLMEQINELSINTKDQLVGIGEMVLEKAISEMKFASTYAKMCCELKELTVPRDDPTLPLNFQSLMLNLCQREVLKDICDGIVLERELQDQRAAKGEDRQNLQELEAKVTAHRKRAVGCMKFLGELHKLGMVEDGVILECVTMFLDTNTAEAMECLCHLITTTDSILDSEALKPEMDKHFSKIESILKKRKLTARVCLMLQGLLELRQVHIRETKRFTEALPFSVVVEVRKAEDPRRPSFGKVRRQHHGQHHDQVRHVRLHHGEQQGHAQDQRWDRGERQGHAQNRRRYHRKHEGCAPYQTRYHREHQGRARDQRWHNGEHEGHTQDQRWHYREHEVRAQDQRWHNGEHDGHAHCQRWHNGEHEGRAQDQRWHHGEHEVRAQDKRWHHGEHEGHAQDQRWHHGEHEGPAQDQRWYQGEYQGRAQRKKWRHGKHHDRVQNQRPYHREVVLKNKDDTIEVFLKC